MKQSNIGSNICSNISSNFCKIAKTTVERLKEEFGKNIRYNYNQNVSPKSIGLEIEVKFKYVFPELHKKYFTDIRYYNNLPTSEKDKISAEISVAEKDIKNLYEKTIRCGVPKGLDKYWEFAFNPVYETDLILYQIDILEQVGLIPKGNHSLHINIGGLPANKKAYIITSALELLYVSKERMMCGIRDCIGPVAWSRKGRAGIREKTKYHLMEVDTGFEIRTTEYTDLNTLNSMLRFVSHYINDENTADYENLEKYISDLLIKYDLPNKNWENPSTNPEIWTRYIDKFDEMSQEIKSSEYFKKFI